MLFLPPVQPACYDAQDLSKTATANAVLAILYTIPMTITFSIWKTVRCRTLAKNVCQELWTRWLISRKVPYGKAYSKGGKHFVLAIACTGSMLPCTTFIEQCYTRYCTHTT